jgi:hypothetical protein
MSTKNIEDILKCDICREYLSLTMIRKGQCSGRSIKDVDSYVKKRVKELKDYFEKNKQHLMDHGFKENL